jgi:hypothetical protein
MPECHRATHRGGALVFLRTGLEFPEPRTWLLPVDWTVVCRTRLVRSVSLPVVLTMHPFMLQPRPFPLQPRPLAVKPRPFPLQPLPLLPFPLQPRPFPLQPLPFFTFALSPGAPAPCLFGITTGRRGTRNRLGT